MKLDCYMTSRRESQWTLGFVTTTHVLVIQRKVASEILGAFSFKLDLLNTSRLVSRRHY